MAAPTLVIATGSHDGLTANIDTFTWPIHSSAAVGDVAVIEVGMNAASTNPFPAPSGWQALGTVQNTGSNHNSQLFTKQLVEADLNTTVTSTLATGAGKIHGGGILVRGAAFPPRVSSPTLDTTAGTTVAGPSITTTSVDNFIVAFLSGRHTGTTKATTTVSSGWTERFDTGTANATQPNFMASCATRNTNQATAGTVTGPTFTGPSSMTGHAYTLAFEPGAPPNVGPTVNAGADQVDVEPYTVVSLSGTTTDPNGVASRAWSVSPAGAATFLSGQTTNNATAKVRGTIAGENITFTLTATDTLGANGSDSMIVSVLPVTERAAVGIGLVPMEWRQIVGTPVDPNIRGLGYIGDGTTEQNNGGAAVRQQLVTAGWPDSALEVDGLNHRTIATNGITLPNTGQVIDGWRANGFDPYTWVFDLGLHNDAATDAAWTSFIGGVLDYVAAGERSAYRVFWVGMAHATVNDPRDSRFYSVLTSLVGTRAKITLIPINWSAYIHNGRDETGLWWDPADTGRYMTQAGYAIRNPYIAGQIGTPT